jgi:tetratricopeptide (TPR) repeat protein
VINLDQEPDGSGDIAEFVWNQLTAGAWAEHEGAALDVARHVAKMAMDDAGAFRFAKAVSTSLRANRLPVGAELGSELDRLAGEAVTLRLYDPPHVEEKVFAAESRDLLTALAFGEFGGLPARDVWPEVATALSANKRTYAQSDVDGVLVRFAKYIVESGEAGQAVYRLYRRDVGERLRQERNLPDAHRRIAASLIALTGNQSLSGKQPERTNPYLLEHLAGYAVMGGPSSVQLYDTLSGGDLEVWLPQLGASLLGFGVMAREQGNLVAAADLANLACDRYRALLDLNRARYTRDLARSLNELFITLDMADEREEAEKAIDEAITLYEELADRNIAAFASSLAGVFYNLAFSRTRRQEWTSAIEPLSRAIEILDRSGDVLIAYRLDLAQDLYLLTFCHVNGGTGAEAVSTAERAVATYRELSAGGSDAVLQRLAETLGLLASCLAEAHRIEEAIAPQVEAADLQVKRCLANPSALSDLTRTLGNLYVTLNEAGRTGEAWDHVEHVLEQLREQQSAVIQLRRLLAQWANQKSALRDAVQQELLALGVAQSNIDEFAVMAICLDLYLLYGEGAEIIEHHWTNAVGPVPSWMSISPPMGAPLYEWLPTASQELFVTNSDVLLSEEVAKALDDMMALVPTGLEIRQRRFLIELMRRPKADYQVANISARITATAQAWLSQPDWNNSRAFLQAHWEHLSSINAERVFAETVAAHPDDRAAWLHRALLRLVREFGVDDAYSLITDRERLQARIVEVQREANGDALLPYSWLLMADSSSATRWALLAIANVYASDIPEAEAALRQFMAIAQPDEIHGQLKNLLALAHEHPGHADALLALAQTLESPTTDTSSTLLW